jgi:hypothetical protein
MFQLPWLVASNRRERGTSLPVNYILLALTEPRDRIDGVGLVGMSNHRGYESRVTGKDYNPSTHD